ncbi:tRNA methyltransferase complex subunit Cpd1 [Pleurotus eryngii]|uniref:tRNA (adenine(58)-N(1))-methyltransferase catalytic subunit TRM61 n=1 Tax=Pleurotus eryngii TaxID=5323 RepID=A0A9P5ZUY0_PLEER|nr:tRNA methyltransferase complex subunit Cpd1 [Pleurotus eryngii]
MWSTAREIALGDTVIAWLTRELIQPLVVTPGKDLNIRFGYYRHDDLVGVPYGSKVGSRNGKGFIHVLRPTPELWTMALPHRTQILYLADIAFITSHLDIKPGSRVVEAGTGSGSFSHSVARSVGKTGHLWSYEFHELRASKAKEEFTRHGLADIVTLTHRNVCKDGFTVESTADAVFLDLPMPWSAIPQARKALRKDCLTRICCFSPCIEQVQRTVTALNDAGFTEITMYESLVRPHEVDQVPPMRSVDDAREILKKAEQKREDKRLRQIAATRQNLANKRKREGETDLAEEESHHDTASGKRTKTDEIDDIPQEPISLDHNIAGSSEVADATKPTAKTTVSKAFPEVRGHTSYLTFACLLPASPEVIVDA